MKLRLHGMMVFRLDFFAPFFIDGSLFAAQLMAFSVIYSNVDTIGTWGRSEMILYLGTFSLLNALSMMICFFGIASIPWKVRSGELDLYLTKPISPLFRFTFESINIGSLPLVLMSLCIIGYGVKGLGTEVGALQIVSYCFWVVVMAVLYYEMEVLIRSVSLYVVSMARLEQLEDAGLELCMKLPGNTFYGIYKVIFYLLLPYGMMATLPVQSMLGEMSAKLAWYGIGVVLLFSVLTAFVWKKGLRKYNSASS